MRALQDMFTGVKLRGVIPMKRIDVTPVKTGAQNNWVRWIPAFAGMTAVIFLLVGTSDATTTLGSLTLTAVKARTEAAALTRSDVDFSFFSTAPSRRREVVWPRTEAAALTRSDVDFAFFSTALSRRRAIVWTRTEAAALTRSDADFALFSTALSRRREIVWTRTEAAARTRSDVNYEVKRIQ